MCYQYMNSDNIIKRDDIDRNRKDYDQIKGIKMKYRRLSDEAILFLNNYYARQEKQERSFNLVCVGQ